MPLRFPVHHGLRRFEAGFLFVGRPQWRGQVHPVWQRAPGVTEEQLRRAREEGRP